VVTSAVESQPVNVDPCEVGQSLSETVSRVPLDVPTVATPGDGKTNVSVCNATMLSDVIMPTVNECVNNCEVINTIDLAMLKFVDIKIAGLDSSVSALADLGSEINVAKSDVSIEFNFSR